MELKNLKTQYRNANPFPHIVIDGFMDEFDARFCVSEMKKYQMWGHDGSEYSKNAQVNKFFTPWCDNNIEDIKSQMPMTWKYLQYYNSPEFIKQLEELTGIKGLLPDNLYEGGGVHRIDSMGKLSIHTDYSKHPRKDEYRRINLLIYLNEGWQDEWGGTLQLWKPDMSEMMVEVQPRMNTAVIFNTTSKSLHGHPHPLNTPLGISRYSIALYYFTKESFETEETVAATWYDIETK
jgi:Rps23 Pro-64 3,4-dihydroxylase Tpa1-like proline 4-hydroxylase